MRQWKQTISEYQRRIQEVPETQGTLFDLPTQQADPETIDPFALQKANFRFYKWPHSRNSNDPVIYSVIDDTVPLILYIGQAVKAHQCWAGEHDCKAYVDQYLCTNYRHRQSTAICIAFWWDTPRQFQPRLQLEAKLIAKWKPPFNKENWAPWATPFTKIKRKS